MWTVRDERVLSGVQRAQHAALGALWVFVGVSFWSWWLAPAHRGALGLYLPATVAMGYLTTVLPSLFWLSPIRRLARESSPRGRGHNGCCTRRPSGSRTGPSDPPHDRAA
jgi:apolipoprotein N-acyltransferase